MSREACPCGSGAPYDECCGPLLAGTPAPSPERLMRSRYTAFTRDDSAYLEATWHPGTRPETIDLDDGVRWLGLDILSAETDAKRGYVEFRAHWRDGGEDGILHERSRFVWQSERWWYLDGVIR